MPVYGALGVWEPSVALPVSLCACVWGSGGLGTQRGITCDPVCLCVINACLTKGNVLSWQGCVGPYPLDAVLRVEAFLSSKDFLEHK